jgi:hypothetical protein
MKETEKGEFNYRPARMESNNALDPLQVFDDFFGAFSLTESREHLERFYSMTVEASASLGDDGEEAARNLYFYHQSEMLLEAAWLINEERNARQMKEVAELLAQKLNEK